MQNGEKNTVCVWYPAQYSSHAFHRLRHYSRQRFRNIYHYLEFVRSRLQPPWQKIQYLLQQASSSTFVSGEFVEKFPSIRPHSTMFHELQVFCTYFDDNSANEAIDPAGALCSLCFPMEMSGGKVAGYLQNTSVTVILTSRAISCSRVPSSRERLPWCGYMWKRCAMLPLQRQKNWWYLLYDHHSGLFSNYLMIPAQENGDYEPSLVSEALSQIEHADNPNQDIELLKDVAAQIYVGKCAGFICLIFFLLG